MTNKERDKMLPLAEIRRAIDHYRKQEVPPINPKALGMTIGTLEQCAQGAPQRKVIMMWLFPDIWKNLEDVTSKDLTNSDKNALIHFVAPQKEAIGVYTFRPGLVEECSAIWNAQMLALGRLKDTPIQEEIPF